MVRKHRTLSRRLLKDHQKVNSALTPIGSIDSPDPNTQNMWIQHREPCKYLSDLESLERCHFITHLSEKKQTNSEEPVVSENCVNVEKHSEPRVLCVFCSSGCILIFFLEGTNGFSLRD